MQIFHRWQQNHNHLKRTLRQKGLIMLVPVKIKTVISSLDQQLSFDKYDNSITKLMISIHVARYHYQEMVDGVRMKKCASIYHAWGLGLPATNSFCSVSLTLIIIEIKNDHWPHASDSHRISGHIHQLSLLLKTFLMRQRWNFNMHDMCICHVHWSVDCAKFTSHAAIIYAIVIHLIILMKSAVAVLTAHS